MNFERERERERKHNEEKEEEKQQITNRNPLRSSTQPNLVMEQPQFRPSEHHIVLIGDLEASSIHDGPSRRSKVGDSGSLRSVDVVGEGEESV